MDWTDSGYGPVASFCGHSYEPLGSIEVASFLTSCTIICYSRHAICSWNKWIVIKSDPHVAERISELKRLLQEERAMYLKTKEEVAQIKAGQADDRLAEMCQQIEQWVKDLMKDTLVL